MRSWRVHPVEVGGRGDAAIRTTAVRPLRERRVSIDMALLFCALFLQRFSLELSATH